MGITSFLNLSSNSDLVIEDQVIHFGNSSGLKILSGFNTQKKWHPVFGVRFS